MIYAPGQRGSNLVQSDFPILHIGIMRYELVRRTVSTKAPRELGNPGPEKLQSERGGTMAKSVAAVSSLDVHPVAGRIGAEISGLRLSRQLSPQTVAAIRDVLLRYKVIFFRDQGHLDDALHEALARSFGDLVAHPTIPPLAGTGVILELDASRGGGRASYWHINVTFAAAYPQASVLRAVVVPSHGGDTIWANTVAAYRVYEPSADRPRPPGNRGRALVLGGFQNWSAIREPFGAFDCSAAGPCDAAEYCAVARSAGDVAIWTIVRPSTMRSTTAVTASDRAARDRRRRCSDRRRRAAKRDPAAPTIGCDPGHDADRRRGLRRGESSGFRVRDAASGMRPLLFPEGAIDHERDCRGSPRRQRRLYKVLR